MKRFNVCFLVLVVIWFCSCNNNAGTKTASEPAGSPLFTLLSPDSSRIQFSNVLTEGLNTNVLMYEYFYNGAGVAIADLNNDGLQDIYFTGNMSDSKLYLNKGNMQFEDITDVANVATRKIPWRTGVTIADVNGDSKPDIFVAYSGKVRGENRINQLFINQGNNEGGTPQFLEQAKQFGLADSSYCTQGYFFDYDKDGDLDMFSLNHNPNNLPVLDEASTADLLKKDDATIGVRMFKNDNNFFTDVTSKTGISSSLLTYGLGAGIADINGDGWQDIYIANDYSVPDFLYINNGNGTFTDKLQTAVGHTAKSSMGNNVADINNDGLQDIFVLDMLPEDNHRQKTLFAPDNYEKFDVNLRSGFYYQYMRNMLQVNNGDGTFSEIGQLAGISNTDWSWAPLFADFDNDGWKDLYVTNGYTRDYTNLDFLKYMNDHIQSKGRLNREDVLGILQQMPASDVENYLFKNNGDLTFSDVSKQWGFSIPSNSNGAAYADLDNDGDLDLVVNNTNIPAFIYRNEASRQLKNHYLDIRLIGSGKNTDGIGTKVTLYTNGKLQLLEQMPARGFQSTVSSLLHFGIGNATQIDSLVVTWLNGKRQIIPNVKSDQVLAIREEDAVDFKGINTTINPFLKEVESPVKYLHAATPINDFKRQPLLVNPFSFSGPCMVKGDVNGDQLEDIFVGGGSGKAGSLFLQTKAGQFVATSQPAFEKDNMCEDADAVFIDCNIDGKLDLYVTSGGYHNNAPTDILLQDRLYINDGKGSFTKTVGAVPEMLVSKSCVRVNDVNADGFPDLFVGGRVVPGRYPETPQSFLLINDGKGVFKDQTAALAPLLQKIGMVTDAAWTDLNGDSKAELIIVGDWMPVSVFMVENGKLENKTRNYFDKDYKGWWNKLSVDDYNKDGKKDLVIGNTGLNTQCKASDKQPAEMFYKDFDDNGSVDPILCFYIKDSSYPYVSRDELLDQMSNQRNRFTDYKSYADASIKNVFTEEELKDAGHLEVNYLKTAFFLGGANGKFVETALPLQAQFSPVFTITPFDINRDGFQDLLLCGNINQARLRFGKSDANYGVVLQGNGKGGFTYINQQHSGLQLKGDVRSVLAINNTLLFGINQKQLKAYKLK
ncbi:MAG: VCBS repeat-containing protein [Bacteroidota bacterium]